MPIKFRCSYCRQFLGISRNRAGELFDCPTCGRTIRVPGLDGNVAPVPEPEWNAGDAHLARALEELAALADGNPISQPVVVTEADAEAEIPQPLPEPEPVEIPLPAIVTPVMPQNLAAPVINESEAGVSASLAELLPMVATTASTLPVSATTAAPFSRGLMALGIISPVVTLLVGLQWGFWLGRAGTMTSLSTAPVAIEPVAVKPLGSQLSGRVSWRTDASETKPDIGALVILWPENWDGALRVPPMGLRPADSEVDQAAAAALIAGMGGQLARTSSDGTYQLTVAQPGRYRRLIVSRLKARGDAPSLAASTVNELQQYLSDPAAVLGERAFSWELQRLELSQNPPADQVF